MSNGRGLFPTVLGMPMGLEVKGVGHKSAHKEQRQVSQVIRIVATTPEVHEVLPQKRPIVLVV